MHENTDIVDRLCEELTSRGIKGWLDRNNIKPGSHWKAAIREASRSEKCQGHGHNIIAAFHNDYESVADFEQKTGVQLPPDIAEMLTQQ